MKTIFDIGMHEGWDSEFYLRKGFRVVAVEANPAYLERVQTRLKQWIDSGSLTIVHKAVAAESGRRIPFHVSEHVHGWSSTQKHMAERDGLRSKPVEVESVTVPELFDLHGVPHYLKCDIEGADALVAGQIAASPEKPRYVSFEIHDIADPLLPLLKRAGYDRFQIVNQEFLHLQHVPNPPREGVLAMPRCDLMISGLFGADLDPAFWSDFDLLMKRLRRWRRLHTKTIDPVSRWLAKRYGKLTRRLWLLERGWLDIHATRGGYNA